MDTPASYTRTSASRQGYHIFESYTPDVSCGNGQFRVASKLNEDFDLEAELMRPERINLRYLIFTLKSRDTKVQSTYGKKEPGAYPRIESRCPTNHIAPYACVFGLPCAKTSHNALLDNELDVEPSGWSVPATSSTPILG